MTAKTWGLRPSSLLQERDEVCAFLLDEALAVRLHVEELNAMPKASNKLPGGLRYEVPADLPPKRREPIVPGPAAHLLG